MAGSWRALGSSWTTSAEEEKKKSHVLAEHWGPRFRGCVEKGAFSTSTAGSLVSTNIQITQLLIIGC